MCCASTEIDPQLLLVASAVRRAMEALYPRKRKTLRNLCTLSACAIVRICKERHIDAEVCGGEWRWKDASRKLNFGNQSDIEFTRASKRKPVPHAWVHHRRNYVDITATQFGEFNRILVTDETDGRYSGSPQWLQSCEDTLFLCGVVDGELEALIHRSKSLLDDGLRKETGNA